MTSLFLTTASMTAATPGAAETTRWKLAGSAGASARLCNKNTVVTAVPVPVTDGSTAGTDGNSVAWYSDPVAAVTIAGQIVASLSGLESATTGNAAPCIGVWRCDSTGAVLSAIADPAVTGSQGAGELATSAGVKTCTIAAVSVVSTALAAGDRLKVQMFLDNAASQGGAGSMPSTRNAQLYANGATGAAGQAQIAFTETILSTGPGLVFPATAGRPVTPVRDAPYILSGS